VLQADGLAWGHVISKFTMGENEIPSFGVGLDQGPQKSSQSSISDFGLPVCLRVASCAIFELGSHLLP